MPSRPWSELPVDRQRHHGDPLDRSCRRARSVIRVEVLVVVVIVRGMPVPVMQIVEVIVVHDGAVAAPVAVDVIVVERVVRVVLDRGGHLRVSPSRNGSRWAGAAGAR